MRGIVACAVSVAAIPSDIFSNQTVRREKRGDVPAEGSADEIVVQFQSNHFSQLPESKSQREAKNRVLLHILPYMALSTPYIDLHTHRHRQDPEVRSVIALSMEQTLFHPEFPRFCSAGRHPWHAATPWTEEQGGMLEDALLREECIAVGEIGLDRVKGPDLGLQRSVLIEQLDLAAARDVPVILHCVRAHADLLQLRKMRGDTNPWIIHGFTGHGELAEQLLRMGFMLSFGEALLSTGAKVREALTHVPTDRMFFETDEGSTAIQVIYRTAADVLGVSQSRLRSIMQENFIRSFGVEA